MENVTEIKLLDGTGLSICSLSNKRRKTRKFRVANHAQNANLSHSFTFVSFISLEILSLSCPTVYSCPLSRSIALFPLWHILSLRFHTPHCYIYATHSDFSHINSSNIRSNRLVTFPYIYFTTFSLLFKTVQQVCPFFLLSKQGPVWCPNRLYIYVLTLPPFSFNYAPVSSPLSIS